MIAFETGKESSPSSDSQDEKSAQIDITTTVKGDVALEIVDKDHGVPIDAAVEARVLRKLDWILVPFMTFGYGLVFYDKAILGSAALLGMTSDLHLAVADPVTGKTSTTRLSWATSLFYFGVLAGVYPLTCLSQKSGRHMGRYLAALICIWSILTMATAALKTWQGLFALRFFLGLVESVVPTAFACITSSFYTQPEQAFRQSIWYSSTSFSNMVAVGVNYGFAQIDGGSLKPWHYLYILAGGLTLLYGMACWGLPSDPTRAWFLNKDEKLVAIERLRRGQTGIRADFKMSQVIESLCDAKVWLVAIMMTAALTSNGAVTGFGPLIVSTFGYSTVDAILLQLPISALVFIFTNITGYLSFKIPNIRIFMVIACCLPVLAGCAMIWKLPWTHHAAAPIVGYTIIGFFGPSTSLIMTIGMANVAGYTKKSVMAATVFIAYALGNIIGPLLIDSKTKAQHYPELWTGLLICYSITIAAAVALYIILHRENKRRDAMNLDESERDRFAFQDLTDVHNPYFRYAL